MTRLHLMKALFVTAAVLGLAACGGGGSSSDSTPQTAAQNVAVISSGTVTGFGSVFVNGVRFETSSAAFTINGKPGTQADLRVGHVVRIHGRRMAQAIARRIASTSMIWSKVPSRSVDAAAGALVVMGQTVLTDAEHLSTTTFPVHRSRARGWRHRRGERHAPRRRRYPGDAHRGRKLPAQIFEVTGVGILPSNSCAQAQCSRRSWSITPRRRFRTFRAVSRERRSHRSARQLRQRGRRARGELDRAEAGR